MSWDGDSREAVAIGGGTGLPVVLGCLLRLGYRTSAVVTMADDGGSTGVLREQLEMLPPGDVRNCLVAMAGDPDALLPRLFQYRFPRGEGLAGHALGNLVIAALADMEGGFFEAIEAAEGLLGARGRVLPSTLEHVVLHGVDSSGEPVTGQAMLATSDGPICRVAMEPAHPHAFPPALEAIRAAEAVVIGPGSLFTSLIPNLLVEGVTHAIRDAAGPCMYVCNVANQRGETHGMDAAQHVEALMREGLEGVIDLVVVHDPTARDRSLEEAVVCDDGREVSEPVMAGADVRARIESMGVRVVAADLVDDGMPWHHDPDKLQAVLEEVL